MVPVRNVEFLGKESDEKSMVKTSDDLTKRGSAHSVAVDRNDIGAIQKWSQEGDEKKIVSGHVTDWSMDRQTGEEWIEEAPMIDQQ